MTNAKPPNLLTEPTAPRDLISIHDLGPAAILLALQPYYHAQATAGGLPRRAGRKADGDVLREAFAAHAADV